MRRIWKLMVAMVFLCVVTLAAFTSCQSSEEEDLMTSHRSSVQSVTERITPSEAIEMAKIAVGGKTRSLPFSSPELEVVKAKETTRSGAANDTVAYIINFADDNGFAIISATRNVYPVLAYSDGGRFDSSNEIAMENFIDRLEDYTSTSEEVIDFNIENDFVKCEVIYPKILMSIGQSSPWNKYVVQEHPGCPAGCGPVAAVLLMCNSKGKLKYHNIEYPFYYIVKALHKHDYPYMYSSSNNPVQRITGGGPGGNTTSYDYTYEQAVDSVGRLLYLVGKDMKATYATDGTSVSPGKPYLFIQSLGEWTMTDYLAYDAFQAFTYIENDYILLVVGYKTNSGVGHAWIIDGAKSCMNDQVGNHPRTILLHCDWGWNGYCNGYYNGEVFEIKEGTYRGSSFFGVKKESDSYKAPTL